MGMPIEFFKRQLMAGNNGSLAYFYSPVIDVTDYGRLVVSLRAQSADPDVSTFILLVQTAEEKEN